MGTEFVFAGKTKVFTLLRETHDETLDAGNCSRRQLVRAALVAFQASAWHISPYRRNFRGF
jgi:hypothetical protein